MRRLWAYRWWAGAAWLAVGVGMIIYTMATADEAKCIVDGEETTCPCEPEYGCEPDYYNEPFP